MVWSIKTLLHNLALPKKRSNTKWHGLWNCCAGIVQKFSIRFHWCFEICFYIHAHAQWCHAHKYTVVGCFYSNYIGFVLALWMIECSFLSFCLLFGGRQQRVWQPSNDGCDGRQQCCRQPSNNDIITTMCDTVWCKAGTVRAYRQLFYTGMVQLSGFCIYASWLHSSIFWPWTPGE